MVPLVVVLAVAGVVVLAAIWPPLWAPEAWRSATRRLRHGMRRRTYRGIDLHPIMLFGRPLRRKDGGSP